MSIRDLLLRLRENVLLILRYPVSLLHIGCDDWATQGLM